MSKISGWRKRVRVWMRVLNAVKRWKVWTKRPHTRSLSEKLEELNREKPEDRKASEKSILRAIQEKHFLEEKRMIVESKIEEPEDNVEMGKRRTCLAAHNPFMDKENLIRVGSRIIQAEVDEDAKCPIILPKEEQMVKDLASYYHEREFHAGAKHTLCQLRQRFWILCGLQAVKSAINRCRSDVKN